MKKILLLITVCGLGFTGCAVSMSTSIKTINVGPETVRALPLTADLNVSDQRVRGEAHGQSDDDERLVREAVARALGQDPPKSDAADVLVAMNVYKEASGKSMTVVVTGYPAWYHNFRTVEQGDSAWLILTNTGGSAEPVKRGGGEWLSFASPGRANVDGPPKPNGMRRYGWYLGANRLIVGSRSVAGEWACLEGGVRGGYGMSYGLEFGGGVLGSVYSSRGRSESIGGGVNIGYTYDLPSNIGQLVYGLSVGFWYGYYSKDEGYYYFNYRSDDYEDYLFGGPFVKVRWKFIELSYRGLMGMRESYDYRRNYDSYYGYYYSDSYYTNDFTYVSQFKAGLHFEF